VHHNKLSKTLIGWCSGGVRALLVEQRQRQLVAVGCGDGALRCAGGVLVEPELLEVGVLIVSAPVEVEANLAIGDRERAVGSSGGPSLLVVECLLDLEP
jgi:hypothetical protein